MNKLLLKDIILNNNKMPQIGIGTYKLTDEKILNNIITNGIKIGYRHIDTAAYYKNEEIIGKIIKDNNINRDKIFITSKIWNADHKYNDAQRALNNILERLQTDYLDLCLIHWPTPNWKECYKVLEAAYKAGKVKSIGVSNFNIHHLEELEREFEIMPTVNQFELHVGFQQAELVKYCQDKNIAITSWATLMQGKIFEVEQIKTLATKYNKTPAQIALKWAIDNNFIIIPKTSKIERLEANIAINDFDFTDEDKQLIKSIPQKRLGADPDNFNF